MTRQHVVGELSVLLAELERAALDPASARELAGLRHETEMGPLAALGSVAARAIQVSDRMCWDALAAGDAPGFARRASIGDAIWEFGLCAGLLEER